MINRSNDTKKQKVKFLTLGCRLNQYETQAMREDLWGAGFEKAKPGEKADVFVINTCTVTVDADRESRYLIRKCHRENPNAKIVVTGCYVERDSKTIEAIPGVTHVLPNRYKSDLAQVLDSCTQLSFESQALPHRSKAEFTPLNISQFEGRQRAHIKIQDGCNHACSFCKVVLVRGKSRSRALEEIVKEAERLRGHGYREIVLTGVQLGAYGFDLSPSVGLKRVLESLISVDGIERIRLSSIEPTDVTDDLIQCIGEYPQICPHLHIPLQSGSDQILRGMNRRYDRQFYMNLIKRIRGCVPQFILTSDVMVGFPGETDRHFEETVEVILKTEPFKLHIFPYSPREGTRASQMGSVDLAAQKRRMNVLFALEKKLQEKVLEQFLGKPLEVLIESQTDEAWLEGRASNYLPIRFPRRPNLRVSDTVRVISDRMEENILIGQPL
ncbi:MAG: tRNA (N(6)-L-threonylcarbamoyladenosine(37)-C(2))-methylthiotransferase MtaB [Candidatus Omnitrophica bacterium CG11_big_fil_rev_8_21_14_0_20_45_26]|uniref:Threonylcarbamoyladenosine tRNA methylthiotransferase MtaB n=1 Tax=Candidatus Abzuiibacterium crystallinum TaxID=1974748 RepID=A0A2H0LNU7_9BACT|nr:MAG: tRNA (N(6)-L-threonylcarbamoyladenosine(37)-C(2))-methylthiotransferase MtaB [Candidatus Omnitrophica bacterium CG11_big_fil_rev_8_21_14_0_20_45_26]PIW65653.1 MAG: tRNA (N(6)-L-threonylcarbamoyladenosine(37)-C(2))-methylthiotransferase MtaB [Candidatus Omnitrophica bacterium CG12_big_fil_rev_8_21_14_0_65_45_16]